MSNLGANSAGVFLHAMGTQPDDNPKTLTLMFPFAAAQTQQFDFVEETQEGKFDTIQSVYIDNDNDATVILSVISGSLYTIIARPRSQGWYPLALTPLMRLQIATTNASPNLRLVFSNTQVCAGPWPTTGGSPSTFAPLQQTVTTAAAQILPQDFTSGFREIKNVSANTIYIGPTSAVTTANGYPLLSGEAFSPPWTGAVFAVASVNSVVATLAS